VTTTLLLVRHAHADWVPDEGRPLSSKGHFDAVRVADILTPLAPDAIYSSPYLRARETVEPLAERVHLPVVEMAELRERSLGHSWQPDWEATIRPTWEDFEFAYPEGGESNAEAMTRAASALEQLRERHEEETVVVATHGNLLVLLLRVLDPDKGYEFWRGLSLPDIYRLDLVSRKEFELQRLWFDEDPS
jgi:2,3-bisphosphoglycerate-dependent phosphoglycerate mutase